MAPKKGSSSQAAAAAAAAAKKRDDNTGSNANVTDVSQDFNKVVNSVMENYVNKATVRTKLIDSFMAFLVLLGVLQFVFCLLVGTFPFNAFLGGFSSTVGQFILTANLRIQTNKENYDEFKHVSPERAFVDFTFGSLILHFIVYHFIN